MIMKSSLILRKEEGEEEEMEEEGRCAANLPPGSTSTQVGKVIFDPAKTPTQVQVQIIIQMKIQYTMSPCFQVQHKLTESRKSDILIRQKFSELFYIVKKAALLVYIALRLSCIKN